MISGVFRQPNKLFVLFLIVSSLSLTVNTTVLHLRGEEPRRAVVSMEMEFSGDYLVPSILGIPYFNKPPGYNWYQLLMFKITGQHNEFSSRLGSILCYLSIMVLIYYIGKREINETTGINGAVIFGTCYHILFVDGVYIGEIDMLLTTLILLQTYVFYYYFRKEKYYQAFIFSYLICSLGVLTKGMPAIAFQGLTVICAIVLFKKYRQFINLPHIAGGLIFFIPLIIYFYAYSERAFLERYLFNIFYDATQRYSEDRSVWGFIASIFFFPANWIIDWLLPWSPLLFLFIIKDVRNSVKSHRFVLFLVCIVLVNCLLYWTADGLKRRYLDIFYPFIGLICAFAWDRVPEKYRQYKKWLIRVFAVIFLIIILALPAAPLISYTQFIPGSAWIVLTLAAVVMVFISIYLWKGKQYPLLYIGLGIMIARLMFNFSGSYIITETTNTAYYSQNAAKIAEITHHKPPKVYGEPSYRKVEAAIGPLKLYDQNFLLKDPERMAYKHIYYLTKEFKGIMHFSQKIEPGYFYLCRKEDYPQKTTINKLYEFDGEKGRVWYLFKMTKQ